MSLKLWLKISTKLFLSRVPIAYSIFRKLSIFRHGSMDNSEYAFAVGNYHVKQAKPWLKENFTALELGPGDSLLSGMNLSVLGASKVYLLDAGEFATKEMQPYVEGINYLQNKGYDTSSFDLSSTSVEALYQEIDLSYLTNGLDSLRTIPDESLDFIYSHAVLEHIRLHEFDDLISECHRILKPNGVCSHNIDLKDHIEKSLNSLRFSQKTWESNLFANSGFYTNRIRHDELIERFKNAGFKIESKETKEWEKLPIDKSKFAPPYSEYTDKNLLSYEIDIILTKMK